MLPLVIAMCLNVILMNLSLTFSSITFYQIARILLTPAVAAINFLFYRKTIPRMAVVSLVPMCLGVGMISYYEPKPSYTGKVVPALDFLGVFLAVSGVLVSAVYMVWVAAYQRRLEMSSFQLLYNQAPLGGTLLIVFIPFIDTLPTKNGAYTAKSTLIFMVGKITSIWGSTKANTWSRAQSVPSSSTFHKFSLSRELDLSAQQSPVMSKPVLLSSLVGSRVVEGLTTKAFLVFSLPLPVSSCKFPTLCLRKG